MIRVTVREVVEIPRSARNDMLVRNDMMDRNDIAIRNGFLDCDDMMSL